MNATAPGPFDPIELPPLTCRLKMLANGYEPIPLSGKRPLQSDWPNILIDEEAVRSSATLGANTGMRTARAPVLDIDIRDEEVSRLIEEFARKQFGGRGKILVRIGDAPKRAIPLRTLAPFKKIIIALVPPDDLPPLEKHPKIEVLGDGQQVAVAGIHPDTGKPYRWRDGLSPVSTPLDELPLVDETEMRAFVDACVSALVERGWRVAGGADRPQPEVVPFIPLGERLEKTEYQGDYGINDGILAMTANLIASGVSVKNVEEKTLQWVRGVWAKIPDDHPDKAGWDWNAQRSQIADACYGFIKRECGNQPRVVDSLPEPMLKKWRDIEARGGSPLIRKRKYWGVEDSGPVEPLPEMEAPPTAPEPVVASRARHKPANILIPFKALDATALPRRAWLYGQHYLRGVVTVTAGMGGRGKSSNSLVETIAMATARPLLGEVPAERCRVWYHCGDDNMEELLRRVVAICQHYKIDMKELEGWLFLTTPREFELGVAEGYMDVKTDEATINRIHEQVEANEIDVAILDPLVKLHGVNESGTGMDRVLGIFQAVADEHGCSIEIVHHTRKNGVGHSDAMQGEDDMRGSSAIHGAVRSQRMVNVMPVADAARLQIPESERRRYIRISTEKPNYAPSGMSSWYKLTSVTIANGDNVGIVELWSHPDEGGGPTPEMIAAGQKAERLFLVILGGHNGPTSSAKTSQYYAPKIFAKHHLAKAAGVSQLALEAALERLLESGKVVVGSEKTANGGTREKLMAGDF